MKKNNLKKIEKEVLEVYKKEDPSIYFIKKSKKDFLNWEAKRRILFQKLLNFPINMFKERSLLDVGSGSGENSIQYANWGAKCTLLEMNKDACQRAKNLFLKFKIKKRYEIINKSIFDFSSRKKFDIVTSNGVIHHTADKKGAFFKMSSFLKPGGFLELGINNKVGSFQRMLQRVIIFRFANTEKEIISLAEKFFKEDIDRAQKYGKRSRRAIIFDEFINPKVDYVTVAEVLQWIKENNLQFYSAYPPILPPVLGDSANRPTFNPLNFIHIGAFAEAFWLVHNIEDGKEIPQLLNSFINLSINQFKLCEYINDFSLQRKFKVNKFLKLINKYQRSLRFLNFKDKLLRKHTLFFNELFQIIKLLDKGDVNLLSSKLKKTRYIFKGTNGLGMMYFMAYKPCN